MLNFIVITVPADGLAPVGARPSAGTVMTKFRSYIFKQYTLEGSTKMVLSEYISIFYTYLWISGATADAILCKDFVQDHLTKTMWPLWDWLVGHKKSTVAKLMITRIELYKYQTSWSNTDCLRNSVHCGWWVDNHIDLVRNIRNSFTLDHWIDWCHDALGSVIYMWIIYKIYYTWNLFQEASVYLCLKHLVLGNA